MFKRQSILHQKKLSKVVSKKEEFHKDAIYLKGIINWTGHSLCTFIKKRWQLQEKANHPCFLVANGRSCHQKSMLFSPRRVNPLFLKPTFIPDHHKDFMKPPAHYICILSKLQDLYFYPRYFFCAPDPYIQLLFNIAAWQSYIYLS